MPDLVGQKHVIIERARGYSSGYSKIYDETRYINALFYLFGSGRGAITLIPDDDIAASKTWTVIKAPSSGTAPSCVTDHNDSTSCSWSVGSGVTDLLQVDLGSAMYGVLRLYAFVNTSSIYWRVSGSNDGTTWTVIGDLTGSPGNVSELFSYISGFRYVKISFNNNTTSSYTASLYTAEFYPDTALPYSRALSGLTKRLVVFVYGSYYQFLEVISVG